MKRQLCDMMANKEEPLVLNIQTYCKSYQGFKMWSNQDYLWTSKWNGGEKRVCFCTTCTSLIAPPWTRCGREPRRLWTLTKTLELCLQIQRKMRWLNSSPMHCFCWYGERQKESNDATNVDKFENSFISWWKGKLDSFCSNWEKNRINKTFDWLD